jgi:hypothetical protein
MRLRRVTEGLASTTAQGIRPKEKNMHFKSWLGFENAKQVWRKIEAG